MGARQGRLTRDGGSGKAQQQERGQRCVGHDCAAPTAGRGRRLLGVRSSKLCRDASHSRWGSGAQGRTAGTARAPSGWLAAGSNFSLLKTNFSFELNNLRISKMLQNKIPVTLRPASLNVSILHNSGAMIRTRKRPLVEHY